MGNVLESFESHQTSPTATADTKSSVFTYDKRGRVLKETTTVNGSTDYAIVEYAYDDLGKLKTKTYGTGDNAVTETYDYNIRGWLTEKSSPVFDMHLRYFGTLAEPLKPYTAPSYTGNITEWEWRHKPWGGNTAVDDATYTYAFTYDKLSRLTDSQQFKNATATPENRFRERVTEYDRNGNIRSFSRTDGGYTNNYTTTYDGNRLMSTNGSSTQFEYDANGNRTFDADNGLNLRYNFLNLTSSIDETADDYAAKYRWLADGTKAGTSFFGGAASIEYLGSLRYLHDEEGEVNLYDASFGGGRFIPSEGPDGAIYTPNYYITDHLGSTRAIIAGGEVNETVNYQPFGSRWNWGFSAGNNWHYFNGKEGLLGGDFLDYGARMYPAMSGIPSWTSQDPLAEKYFSWSPYAYCLNNPVLYIDPDGRWPFPIGGSTLFDGHKFLTDKEYRKESGKTLLTLLSWTDLDDVVVLASTGLSIIPGIEPVHVDGSPASSDDLYAAEIGLFLPVASGNAVNKVGKAVDEVVGKSGKLSIEPANKISRELLNPPTKSGNAPTFKSDGTPVEIHHKGQNPDGPFEEMHRYDHRMGDNYKANHPNGNKPLTKEERNAFNKQRKEYWRYEYFNNE